MTIEITSTSPDDTLALGRRFAAVLTAGDIVLLSGRLGAGKTLFVSGVADGLGITERVTSPSFVIARIYRGGFL
ncbi:TsaE protein, required for threonylcarbamoyladenosine t(6)A37 formation in tRNA, partial [hydrothermal vent metagenome]